MLKQGAASRAYLVIDREGQINLKPHPDHLTIQSASGGNDLTISIDRVRELIHWINLKPFNQEVKTALIKQAQKMTLEAQSALLKVLEEPAENTVIILTVDDERNLLPTIRSRCLRIGELEHWKVGALEGWRGKLVDPTVQPSNHLTISSNYPTTQQSNYPQDISQVSIAQLFQLAESLAKKERGEIIETLNAWTLSLRQSLLKNPNAATLDQLKNLKYTQEVLKDNVNKRLALENLMLSLG